MAQKNYPYMPPHQLAENLWEVRGEWSNKFGRRMAVVRLRDGRLFLHSSIRLDPPELAWLKAQGKPAFIVAPNIFHCSDAGWMAREFPEAELFVPQSKISAFAKEGLSARDVNKDFPPLPELRCLPMQGTRIEEAAFLHAPSRTLILCDLAFNMNDVFTGFERMMMGWNKVGGLFGPSRLTKLVFTKNKRQLLQSSQDLLREDFDRVIVNHGEVLESGGREKLREGIERIF